MTAASVEDVVSEPIRCLLESAPLSIGAADCCQEGFTYH
jgi:hypothetical protein